MSVQSNPLSNTIHIDVLPIWAPPSQNRTADRCGIENRGAEATCNSSINPVQPADYLCFFENAYDAALITDLQGAYVNANRRVTELLGYDRQALQQVNFWQLISGADAGLMETVRNSLASERFLRITAWCIRQDGSSFPAEIAVNQFSSGKSAFLCFFIRDETLRAQAETQLRTIQNAVKNASAGIGVAGLDGTIRYANGALAALFGEANPKNLKGITLDALLGNGKLVQTLVAAVKEGRSALVEFALPRADGATRWIQISAAPNLDPEDALIGMVLSLVDISDRRRAEQAERVVERDRVMMESLGAVCHHLGQPATVLLSTLELVSRLKESDEETRKELLQMSLDAAENLRQTMMELNEIRHYNVEAYPGPTAARAASIVALPTPAA